MTHQDIQLLEEYGLLSIGKDIQSQQSKLQQKTVIIQQQTNNDLPLRRCLLDQPRQCKKWASQRKTKFEDDEDDEDLLPIGALQSAKTKGLYRYLSAAEKYKNSILNQDPELKSVLAGTRKADVDRDLRRLDQYHKESDDDDDNIPLFQTYHSLFTKKHEIQKYIP